MSNARRHDLRPAELLPEFTRELCDALSARGDRHLAEQIESSVVHACSYDARLQIAPLRIEPQGDSLTAETHVIGAPAGRRSVSVSPPHVVVDISNFGSVQGLEVFSASTLASKLSAFNVC